MRCLALTPTTDKLIGEVSIKREQQVMVNLKTLEE